MPHVRCEWMSRATGNEQSRSLRRASADPEAAFARKRGSMAATGNQSLGLLTPFHLTVLRRAPCARTETRHRNSPINQTTIG